MSVNKMKKKDDNPLAKDIEPVETTQLFSSGKNEFKKLNSQNAGNI
jgi:hypothetical protein